MDSTDAALTAGQRPIQPRPRILAVDDQRDAIKLLQLQLRTAGMDCFVCYDGPAALDFLSREQVDVILLDVMMPEMDGYELCERLKASERTRDIPILFLTAKSDLEDRVRGLALGGHDFLSKPVQQQELLARTRAALRVKSLQDQLKEKIRLQQEVDRLHQGMLSQHWQNTLGQLAASLAHEINNPLAIALGMVQLLAWEQRAAPLVQERLQAVDESLQRAAGKLRSLLLIAHNEPLARPIELAALVQDVLALVQVQVLLTGADVRTDLDPTCCWAGVAGEIGRAVLALLNNALEAVQGRPKPILQVELKSSSSQYTIRISDSGPGIADQIRQRIFEPFFTTKAAPHQGVGLGLVRQILLKAGGSVFFESPCELGGAAFSISLPRQRPAL